MWSATHLVPALVSNKHYERTVVLFDIVVDEDGDARVELLAHERGAITGLGDKTQNNDICLDQMQRGKAQKTATEVGY